MGQLGFAQPESAKTTAGSIINNSTIGLDLEKEAISRQKRLPIAPHGKETIQDYSAKIQNVLKDVAARVLTVESENKIDASTSVKTILSAIPNLIAEDRFFLTATPPEEYRRTGTIKNMPVKDQPSEYYLVDKGEELEAFETDFKDRQEVYLLRIRIVPGYPRHDVDIDSFECTTQIADSIKNTVNHRLFEAQNPVSAPLHQPKALPEINQEDVHIADKIIQSEWSSYCWGERFRKIGTAAAWIGTIIGTFILTDPIINSASRGSAAEFGAKLGIYILMFGGFNLLVNNIKDIRTASRLDDIMQVLTDKNSSEQQNIEALTKLKPSDYEFLAQRAQYGPVQLSIVSRYSSHTETTLSEEAGVEMLRIIGTEALKRRDELMAMGIFVPHADWYAQRLGEEVSEKKNSNRRESLSKAISETVEKFRQIGWESSKKAA